MIVTRKSNSFVRRLSKDIYKERDWVYSMAVMYYGLGKTEKSLELLHTCSDLDQFFNIISKPSSPL